MASNVQTDPATFRFPDPPRSSIDKDLSQLKHAKRHFPTGSTRLQPRSAGFSYIWELEKSNRLGPFLEARTLNKQICEELVKGPPSATRDDRSAPEHRKHSLKTVFRSRSKRKSSQEDKKMPVATHRTSNGRKYGQILSGQIYESSRNASTYQVNQSGCFLAPPASKTQREHRTGFIDSVGDVTSSTHGVNGAKETVGEHSAHRGLENGETKHRLSPYQAVGYLHPTPGSPGNRPLADKVISGNTAAGRDDPNKPKPLNEAAAMQSSSRQSTTDDSLGLLRDLSQILSRGETTSRTAGASQAPGPEAEHQPRVRDFAANGSAPFSRARAAIRRRSRSPVKWTGKQIEPPVTPDRSLDAFTSECGPANPLARCPNSIILPPIAFKEPARPLAQASATNQEQAPGIKISPAINYHSKESSVVSTESAAEDIQSDTSSGIVSNAQSAVLVKVPPQPGPAPLTPLPSLPEGADNLAPATPRASQSSHRLASLEVPPPKVPPQKSPARSQYKLYPSVDCSPPKRPGSPIRMNAATKPEQVVSQPSPPLRSKRRGISFPRSYHLPTSMSVGTLDELEQWKKERAENTRQKKLRDLARTWSHKATVEDAELVARYTVNGERYHDGIAEVPNPTDSDDAALFPLNHRQQPSQVSNLSATTTLQHRDSSTLSQRLSPIIVVAEQEPTSPVQRAPSQKSRFSRNSIDEHPRGFKTNGFHPVPPHLASSAPQGPEHASKIRPVSSHSLPVPRPVASWVPTPHLSPLLRGSSRRSSHHSSMHETSSLEARLTAMERKNAMLEKAFLAVLNTSAALGGTLGSNGMEGTNGDSSSDLYARDGDRTSGMSGTDSLYMGLENLLALHGGSTDARWSTSSGP